MKRILTLIMCLSLLVGVVSGCAKNNKATSNSPVAASQSSKTTAKSTAVQSATPSASQSTAATAAANTTASKSPNSTSVVDNSTIFMIDNFNNMSDPLVGMKPIDLAAYGIQMPAMSLSSDDAEEGNALKVPLNANTWCQAFQIDDTTRLSSFTSKANSKYYFRMYISNQSQIPIGFTISFKDGTNSSFLDSTLAVLTDTSGTVVETQTSNATNAVGDGSALTVPNDFTGWVAWPLSDAALKAYPSFNKLTDLSKVNYINIDVRPVGAADGDFYIVDNLCLSDSTHGTKR